QLLSSSQTLQRQARLPRRARLSKPGLSKRCSRPRRVDAFRVRVQTGLVQMNNAIGMDAGRAAAAIADADSRTPSTRVKNRATRHRRPLQPRSKIVRNVKIVRREKIVRPEKIVRHESS